ncbi:MAG: helix-turn-helix transcriptional regulator [Spirochaetota bacterium]
MLVVEKTHHINVQVTGEGVATVQTIIKNALPDAIITDDSEDTVVWKDTDLAKEIKALKTPGRLLRAYRERAGMSIVELSRKVGTKYPNISAMENDRRTIGLRIAKKLGKALNMDFRKLLS